MNQLLGKFDGRAFGLAFTGSRRQKAANDNDFRPFTTTYD